MVNSTRLRVTLGGSASTKVLSIRTLRGARFAIIRIMWQLYITVFEQIVVMHLHSIDMHYQKYDKI